MHNLKSKGKIKVSEIFGITLQGEGRYTGVPSIWLRTFGCPLRCSGFSQNNPMDSSTWDIPYKAIDPKKYNSIIELPVFNKCCDTYYAIDPTFKDLSPVMSLDNIIEEFIKRSPDGTLNDIDLCFTGGEPLLWENELAEIVYKILTEYNIGKPNRIQIETNSTKLPNNGLLSLQKYIDDNYYGGYLQENGICFNISPKLHSVSGEHNAINYDNIKFINDNFTKSSLKFVANGTKECWDELDYVIDQLRNVYMVTDLPIYIMPVGATKEQQEDSTHLTKIVNESLKRKLCISGRLHCNIFGNTPGT